MRLYSVEKNFITVSYTTALAKCFKITGEINPHEADFKGYSVFARIYMSVNVSPPGQTKIIEVSNFVPTLL